MKAVIRTQYGSTDELELREVDKPVPEDNQVLVKIHAVSINPLDYHVLHGTPFIIRLMGFGIFKPKHQIIGADISGVVESVGKDVTQFKPGDEVYGSGIGGFAEYACYQESRLVLKPVVLSFEQAAAVPIAGLTALQALRDKGQVQSGQNVLIHGASGGVGTFAIQIAKMMGAHVTGVCSGKKAETVKSIGADNLIDYTKEKYWENETKYDLIIDNAAYYPISKPLSALKPGGIYVPVGGSTSFFSILTSFLFSPLISKIKKRKIASFITDMNQSDLAYLNELMEAKKVVPLVGKTFLLDETANAIQYVENGHANGKVVITV